MFKKSKIGLKTKLWRQLTYQSCLSFIDYKVFIENFEVMSYKYPCVVT